MLSSQVKSVLAFVISEAWAAICLMKKVLDHWQVVMSSSKMKWSFSTVVDRQTKPDGG